MTEDKKDPEQKTDKEAGSEEKSKWSTGAKVGAAVGSAAVAAALIYAGRHKMKKVSELKSDKPKDRYENEPLDDADEEGEE